MRLDGFFSRMCLMLICRRRSLPVPVTLKRFLAPLWVFILGIGFSLRRVGRPVSPRWRSSSVSVASRGRRR